MWGGRACPDKWELPLCPLVEALGRGWGRAVRDGPCPKLLPWSPLVCRHKPWSCAGLEGTWRDTAPGHSAGLGLKIRLMEPNPLQ